MIQGFIQLEEHTLNFQILPEEEVIYTVSYCLSGEHETISYKPACHFFAALAYALDREGELHTPGVTRDQLINLMPESDNLRWIP